jgi:hypothetical protein
MFRKTALACAIAILAFSFSESAFADGLNKPVSQNPEAQKLIEQAWLLQATEYNTANYRQCIAWMESADR